MREFIVKTEQKLREFTDDTFPQASFCFHALLKNKDIRVNGVKTGENVALRAGDRVTYYTTPAQEQKAAYYPVYEDRDLLVVDKESGVNSEGLFSLLTTEREEGAVHFLHRLDRNTRGLIAFAKNAVTTEKLLSAFRERKAEKVYHALCVGTMPAMNGVLTAYLSKDAARATVQISKKPCAGAEKIVTEYRVLKRSGNLSYLEVTLHTGKTHQIRAHLAFVGCPVLGDEKYGNAVENRRFHLTRQCLVAKRLRFLLDDGAVWNGKIFTSRFELPEL